jgi:hypothetical protein
MSPTALDAVQVLLCGLVIALLVALDRYERRADAEEGDDDAE